MPVKTLFKIKISLLAVTLLVPLAGSAQTNKPAPAKPMPKKSIFVLPSNPREGRDPFYPESARPYEAAAAAVVTSHVAEVSSLVVKGYSVVNGTPCVIINNHSFMAGDEGDVLVPGGRIHVRCLAIRPSVAVVEVNGQKRDLNF